MKIDIFNFIKLPYLLYFIVFFNLFISFSFDESLYYIFFVSFLFLPAIEIFNLQENRIFIFLSGLVTSLFLDSLFNNSYFFLSVFNSYLNFVLNFSFETISILLFFIIFASVFFYLKTYNFSSYFLFFFNHINKKCLN